MKILTHCYEFPPIGGGGAKVVFGLSKDLIDLGHEVDLVTMKFRSRTPSGQIAGLPVPKVPCIRTGQFICYTPELATNIATAIPFSLRVAKNRKYHINHTHFVFPDGVVSWILKKRTGSPFILSVHGSDVPGYNPDRLIGLHKVLFPLQPNQRAVAKWWKKLVFWLTRGMSRGLPRLWWSAQAIRTFADAWANQRENEWKPISPGQLWRNGILNSIKRILRNFDVPVVDRKTFRYSVRPENSVFSGE